jgi:ankyrin repeat protein
VNFNEEETDYYLSAASAVMELANSLLQHNENTSSLPDMSVDSDPNGAIAATTTGTTTTTKQDPKNTKKLSISPALPITGSITKFHSIVLCKDISRSVLDKGLEILDLVKKFSSKKSQVAVKLLQTVQVLLRLPGGRKNLLSQASTSTTEATTALFDWPFVKISAEDEQQPVLDKDYSRLVGPILDVINDASTDFNQIETAVQILKTLTTPSEAEDTLADAQSTIASVPAATATTPAAIAAAQAALTAAITSATNQLSKITDGIIRESDYFANVAVISGALISLIGLCDKARVKLLAKDIKLGSIDVLYEQILELVTYYLTLGTQRQQQAESKRQNLLEQITTTLPTANIDTSSLKTIEFQSKWTPLLDLQFDLTRFGYKNYSAMLLATELGLFQIVQQLLEAGASTETKNAEGTSALMLAFLQGHEQLVDLLLKYHADIDAINNHHLNVLGCALVGSQSINVHTWIDEAYDTDKSDSHEAYQRLSLLPSSLGELVLKCLNHSVDLNISDLEGNFLLHSLLSEKYVYIKIRGLDIGFHYQSEDTSQLGLLVETLLNPLLSNGANPNILDQHGFAGIHYACMGFCGLEGVEEILRASVKYEIIQGEHVDKGKYKSKQEKLAMAIDEILSNGFREIVNPRALSLRCATTNKILHLASKSQGLLSFHMACGGAILALEDGEPAIPFDTTRLKAYAVANAETRAEILSFLQKKHQVELTASTIQGFNGLHLAMKSDVNGSNHNVTQVLLKANVDVNAVHEYSAIDTSHRAPEAGDRVLYDQEEAIVCSRSFVTRRYHLFLTKRCVHVDNIALSGLKPAENIDYFRLVMESSLSPLHYALQRSDAASKSLLETGKTQLLQSDGCDVPLLALACAANRSIEIIGAMINEQANVRVALKINDIKSGTALHYAVSNGNTPVVQALVSHPEFVSVNVRRSGDGYTPLHIAVAEHARDVELLRVLLNGGGSLLETCDEYVTPLHLLIQQTQLETLKELVESGHLSPELLTREIPDINGNCSSILRFAEEINLKLYHLVAASNRSSISNQELSIPLVPVVEDDDQQKKDKSNQLMAFLLDVVSSIEGVVHVHESFSNGMILPEWNKKKSIIEKSTGRVLKVSSISSIPQE